ncbi:hypothetical protein H0H92_009023 [Tricholoma furcatifolium]|nr:hypothetical protein H0H92_009023 [Tricholoma furcatifolium]
MQENDIVDESPDLEDGESVPDEGENVPDEGENVPDEGDIEGDAVTVSDSAGMVNKGTDSDLQDANAASYDPQGFEDGTDGVDQESDVEDHGSHVDKGADLDGDAADIVEERATLDADKVVDSGHANIVGENADGTELDQVNVEDEGASEARSDIEDVDYVDSQVDEGEAMSVIDLSEEEELEASAKNELDGLIVMDELPDNADKRKKVAKLPGRGDGIDFENMSKEERDIYDEAAKEAIDQFLRRPNTTTIDTRLRRYIREHQSFMPIAAMKTRQLALHILTSNRGNVMCTYHHVVERSGYLIDGEGDYAINGVPRARKVNHVISDGVKRPKGYLHCGCDEDVALLDFYFWKSWSLTAKLRDGSRVTETLKDKMLEPRVRAFVVDQFQSWTGLTINDIYQGDMRKDEHKLNVLHRQIEHVMRRMNKVAARVEGERYFLSVEDLE